MQGFGFGALDVGLRGWGSWGRLWSVVIVHLSYLFVHLAGQNAQGATSPQESSPVLHFSRGAAHQIASAAGPTAP